MENKKSKSELLVESYKKYKCFKKACFDAQLSALVGYKILKMSKHFNIDDRLTMGTAGSRLGAKYEKEFMRLVPKAIPINELRLNNPKFDFIINDFTVDVKASSLIKRTRKNGDTYFEWHIKMVRGKAEQEKGAQFYAVFCVHDDNEDYDIYLIPSELFIGVAGGSIKQGMEKESDWWDFRIEPSELAQFFDDLVDDDLTDVYLKDTPRMYFKTELTQCKRLINNIKRTVNGKHGHATQATI